MSTVAVVSTGDATPTVQGLSQFVPHAPINASDTASARAVVARTDPNEQESVELLPDLDHLRHVRA